LKVRYHLLRGLNLAAQSSVASYHHRAAGWNAMSSANSYPEISLGDGVNDITLGYNKYQKDSHSSCPNTLNPPFYRYYEFDYFGPQDWKFTVNLKNYRPGVTDS